VSALALDRFFADLCPSQAPGYAWCALGPGSKARRGFGGLAVVQPEPLPVTDQTLFDLASLTKPLVTALLALQAQDRGEVDLRSSVPGASPPSFTWLQLLRHQAGFPAWLPLYAAVSKPSDLLQWLLGRCPRSQPGEKTVYGCPGYVLLGLLLERVLQAGLGDLFARRLAAPLGLRADEACFRPSPALRSRAAATEREPTREAEMARQHGAAPPAFPEPTGGWGVVDDGNARFAGGVSGNAGLFGTLRAVEVLATAYRPSRGFLSDASLALAWENGPEADGELRTAGWKSARSGGWSSGAELAPGAIGHEGYTGTGVWLEREEGHTFILLTNRIHPHHPGTDFGPTRAAFLRAAKEAL